MIALNANATPGLVGTLLQTLRYTSTAIGTHDFDVTVSDGAGGATSETARASLVVQAPLDTVEVVIRQTDDGGEVIAVDTPVGPAVLVTTPVQVSGDAVADLFAAAEGSSSPIARAFFSAVNANNVTPIALAFEAALNDSGLRASLATAVGLGRAIYFFAGGDWQLLDLSGLGAAGDQVASGTTGADTGPPAVQVAAPADLDPADGEDVLGADQLAALPVLGTDQPAERPVPGGRGAEGFGRQVAQAALGFDREAAELAAAVLLADPPAQAGHGV